MPARFNSPPNWPTPPAGWRPPGDWRPDPAWGEAPAGWSWWVDDDALPERPAAVDRAAPVHRAAPVPAMLYGAPQRRSTGLRVVLLLGVLVGLAVVRTLVPVMGSGVDALVFGYSPDPLPFEVLGIVVTQVAILVAISWACPKVGYRRRDWLFALIPVYGWVWPLRIIWRMTGLPHRDWPERLDAQPLLAWPAPVPASAGASAVPVSTGSRFSV